MISARLKAKIEAAADGLRSIADDVVSATPAPAVSCICRGREDCPSYYKPVTPTDDWRCPDCNSFMRWGYKHDDCPRCGQHSFWTRRGNIWDCHCLCTETPEQRKTRLEYEAKRRRRDAADEKREREAQARRTERLAEQKAARQAKKCWEVDKKRSCSVARYDVTANTAPFPFCKHCPRWKETTHGT